MRLAETSPAQDADTTNQAAVLVWLAPGPGAVSVAGYIVSHMLERFPAWGMKLTGLTRGAIVVGLSVGLAFGAYFLLRAPPNIEGIQPYHKILVLTLLAFAGAQWAFLQQKGAGDLTRPKPA